ncbi:MAG: magnesium transporter [Flavobacteriaceae bacterium]|nr:magnesium transporter [Flavobacteriaceae bacterium]OUV86515.1 MAG: magnesium transporter [Flavobacteriaceae bacterium TMED145]
MKKNEKHTKFVLTDELISKILDFIKSSDDNSILETFSNYHHADIAEIIEELNSEEATYIIKLLDSEKTSDVLMELDDDYREKILKNLSIKEIAEEVEELDSDDATDIISELPEEKQKKVISKIIDAEHKADIKELLKYDEDSAGGLMAKELIKVNENWTVTRCVKEMRSQASEVTRVHSVYVIDNDDILLGRLSLKDLLVANPKTKIRSIYKKNVDHVYDTDPADSVASTMQKYDLGAIPVVNKKKKLLGRITIDDIVDLIKEEAEEDYQLAAGILQDVDVDDTIFELTKARLPWLIVGLIGGIGAAFVMVGFDEILIQNEILFYFTPLIAAMAGNVGVQSSAIIVQGLANDDIRGSINNRLFKETLLSILNGVILAILLFLFIYFWKGDTNIALALSVALVAVVIVAGIIGTFIPLFLNKRGIDPAIATGPFITTSNDIFGILIYFMVAKLILQI